MTFCVIRDRVLTQRDEVRARLKESRRQELELKHKANVCSILFNVKDTQTATADETHEAAVILSIQMRAEHTFSLHNQMDRWRLQITAPVLM